MASGAVCLILAVLCWSLEKKKTRLWPFLWFTVPPRSTNNIIPLSLRHVTVEDRSVLLLVNVMVHVMEFVIFGEKRPKNLVHSSFCRDVLDGGSVVVLYDLLHGMKPWIVSPDPHFRWPGTVSSEYDPFHRQAGSITGNNSPIDCVHISNWD